MDGKLRPRIRIALSGKHKKILARIWVLLLVGFVVYLATRPVEEWQSVIDDAAVLSEQVEAFGFWSPVVIVVINILLVIFAMLPGHVVVIAAGYLFGLIPGFLLNHIAILLGSIISFAIARRFGRPIVERLAPADILDRLDETAKGHGFAFFLACYALPLFPADALNFVAGLSPLSFRSFVLANLLGRAWVTFAITAAGAYSTNLLGLHISPVVWVLILIASLVIYWTWQSYFSKKRGAV